MLYVQKENKIYYLKGDSFECLSWSKVQTLSSQWHFTTKYWSLFVAKLHKMKQLRCRVLRKKLNIVIINRLSREIYLVFFYEITNNLYVGYRLFEVNTFTENQEEGIWEFFGRKEFQENKEVVTNEFKNALKVGYEQGKDQNILKETYIDVLNDAW